MPISAMLEPLSMAQVIIRKYRRWRDRAAEGARGCRSQSLEQKLRATRAELLEEMPPAHPQGPPNARQEHHPQDPGRGMNVGWWR
jgi:hypothetical protein